MRYSSKLFRNPLFAVLGVVVIGCQAGAPGEAASDADARSSSAAIPPAPPGFDYEAPAFEFEEVLPGIYHARGTGSLSVGSNGAVIVNEDDVLVVDSHISAAAATALLRDIEASITDKPVRYVVNTHYHFDHAHGNQIYPSDVQVIGHEVTREMLRNGQSVGRSYELFVGSLPDQIAAAEASLESAPEGQRAQLETRLAYLRNYLAGQEGLQPTGPNTTLSERMTLFRGDREIQLLFFGRGHTGGDVVVYLPRERAVVTGDLMVPGLPYMGDGYLDEWIETLEQVKELEFDWVLPGHGVPFQEKERIGYLQDYMRDLLAQATALHGQGMTYQDAATRIDMTGHVEHYPNLTGPGAPEIAVLRIFELLDGAAN